MVQSLYQKWQYLDQYNGWIAWNLFLAFIPLLMSFYLFRQPLTSTAASKLWKSLTLETSPRATKSRSRPLKWWIGLFVYAAFLPNAPYVLTDVVHLIAAALAIPSVWIITLFYIPLHAGAMLAGFECYVMALINQSAYLRRTGLKRAIIPLEWLTHGLCALGIYLGRFRRLNSWDLITAPQNVLLSTLDDLTQKRPLIVILVTVLVLGVLYWVMKQVTIGLLLRVRELRARVHSFD
jgi:uncharacterized membrane protein